MTNIDKRIYLLLSALIAIVGIIIFQHYSFLTLFLNRKHPRVFTASELAQCNGIDKPELYLAIMGIVYNVTKGGKHYGVDGTYHVFVGRDATRSFVTGEFTPKGLSDNVVGFNNEEFRSLQHWIDFYQKTYQSVGKLIGRYYDESGNKTPFYKQVKKLLLKARREKDAEEIDKMKFPPCNVEWTPENGSRVWCTKQSGGITRNWNGVPRKYYQPGSQEYRCACVKKEDLNLGTLRIYSNCEENSESCIIT